MTPILLALQAATATAIAAPITPGPTTFVATPTAAARALSVEAVSLPAQPASFTFQCLASDDGEIGDCIEATDGGTRDVRQFVARITSRQTTATDPVRGAAFARLRFYRLRPAKPGKETRSLLIRETVSVADLPPTAPATATVDQKTIKFEQMDQVRDFYPPSALRADAQTRVSATCRVLADRSLWCRDARTDLPPLTGAPPMWRAPEFDPAFERATLLALATVRVAPTLATGGTSIERDARITIRWALPS